MLKNVFLLINATFKHCAVVFCVLDACAVSGTLVKLKIETRKTHLRIAEKNWNLLRSAIINLSSGQTCAVGISACDACAVGLILVISTKYDIKLNRA